jgi:hypothetical protein
MLFVHGGAGTRRHGVGFAHVSPSRRMTVILGPFEIVNSGLCVHPDEPHRSGGDSSACCSDVNSPAPAGVAAEP